MRPTFDSPDARGDEHRGQAGQAGRAGQVRGLGLDADRGPALLAVHGRDRASRRGPQHAANTLYRPVMGSAREVYVVG